MNRTILKTLLLLVLFSCCTVPEKQRESSNQGDPIDKELLLRLVNAQRSQGCQCGDKYYPRVAPLVWNDKLATVAQKHSDEMAQRNQLTHNSKNGDDLGKRLSKAGYHWRAYAENIAMGSFEERTVIEGWLMSPKHCANIMNPHIKEMGIARKGRYWTQVFGSKE